jgi:hypothetical protein
VKWFDCDLLYCGMYIRYDAVTRKQLRNGVSCSVRADGCLSSNGIRYAIDKQQFHCNREQCFPRGRYADVVSMTADVVRGLKQFNGSELLLEVEEPRRWGRKLLPSNG